jgi:hypothetical protein
MCPLGHRASFASHEYVMPRRAYGLATRTRRPRPSEKNAARVIPGFSPQGHPSSDSPPPGGAGSARPQRWQCLHRKITPLRRPACYAPMIMLFLGLRPGRYLRTRRPRPSENNASRAISGISPQGRSSLDSPPRGGAGSARPQGWHNANSNVAPLWPPSHRQPMG